MSDSGAIATYVRSLSGLLGFDPALARSVRAEVEDHLRESASAQAAADPAEAERRAVAAFGDPHVIAARIAAVAIASQSRRVGATVLLVLTGVLLAMATRVGWYEVTQWELCERAIELAGTLGLIDRCAFVLAIASGVAGWAARGRRLRLWAIASAGLVASVICDGLLTALRLSGWEFSVDFLVPLASMAIEVACAALLVVSLRRFTRAVEYPSLQSLDHLVGAQQKRG